MVRLAVSLVAACMILQGSMSTSFARITRIQISHTELVFNGEQFGNVGQYQRLTGRAYGEIDPADPKNAIIQDLNLAPRNARGMVEYSTSIEILEPKDMARGNHVLLFEVVNRGNKIALAIFNGSVASGPAQRNSLSTAGDGYLMREGYTLIWFGWQQDVLAGADRMVMEHVVAHHPDGSPVTGLMRAEITVDAKTPSLPISAGWFTRASHDSYSTVELNNRVALGDGFVPTLSVRERENELRRPIPNEEWSFAKCPHGGEKEPDPKTLCYPAGFKPGLIYELIYRAKDPLVMGLGFTVTRDLGDFLRNVRTDDAANPNPVYRSDNVALLEGSSQSGRMIRTFLHLGFNEAESGKRVFDGAYPHIGGGLIAMNIRFAQPGHAWGAQVDHLLPAYDFPFSYVPQYDPVTERKQGLLDRCQASGTCPRVFHVATVLEFWEGRQSLGVTDPLGRTDLADPPNVRTFIMAGTQHAPAPLPLAPPDAAPYFCHQQLNPNPQLYTNRALLRAFTQWVRDDVAPPDSVVPRISDGTLVAADQVHFPSIPRNTYGGVERAAVRGLGSANMLHVLDFGPAYNAGDSSGIVSIEPPREGSATYGVLVPQVNPDGNDIGGIRSVFLQVPVGTYTGWNKFRPDFFGGGQCSLGGSFIPFAPTRADRTASGDPRASIEERYPTKDTYVAAFRAAADQLVRQRLLLPEDASTLVAEAEREGIRKGP
jgi:hypothetical protein